MSHKYSTRCVTIFSVLRKWESFQFRLVFNFPHDRLTTQTAGLGLRNRAIIRPGRALYLGRTIKPVPSLSGNVRSTSDEARTRAPMSGQSVRGWIIIFPRNEGDLVVTEPTSRFTRSTFLCFQLLVNKVVITFLHDSERESFAELAPLEHSFYFH